MLKRRNSYTIRQHHGINIFFIVIACLLMNSCDNSNKYFILLNEAYGLKEGDLVTIKGKAIGEVKSIDLNGNKVLIMVKIDRKFPIYSNSKAIVKEVSILGNKNIEIVALEKPAPPLPVNDTIEGVYMDNGALNHILKKADSITTFLKDSVSKR